MRIITILIICLIFTGCVNPFRQNSKDETQAMLTASERIDSLRLQGKLEKALKLSNEMVESFPGYPESYRKRAEVNIDLKNFGSARNDVNKLFKMDTNHPVPYILSARLYFNDGDSDRAFEDLDKAVEVAPEDALTYSERGYWLFKAGQYEKAEADITKAIELDPNYYLHYARRADVYKMLDKYDLATDDLNHMVKANPELAHCYEIRAEHFIELVDYVSAEKDILQALSLEPDSATHKWTLGYCCFKQEKYDKALEAFDDSIEIDPTSYYNFFYRAEIHRLTGNFEQALQDFDRAIELDPKSGASYYHKALCVMGSTGDNEQISYNLTKAIEAGDLEDTLSYAYYLLSRSQFELRKFKDALSSINQAISLDPSDPDWYSVRSEINKKLGNDLQAATDLRTAAELGPDDIYADYKMGQMYYDSKDYPNALLMFNNVVAQNPDISDAYSYLGWIYRRQKNYLGAISEFTKAIELEPDNAEYLTSRGDVYLFTGQNDKAKLDYENAVSLDPDCRADFELKELNRNAGIEQLTAELEENPDAGKYIKQSYLHKEKGEYKESIKCVEGALKLDPENIDYLNEMAHLYDCLSDDDGDGAREYSSRVLKLDPDNYIALMMRARYSGGEEKRRALRRAIEIKPDEVLPYRILANSYRGNGDWDSAIREYSIAIKQFPDNSQCWGGRALMYLKRGDYELSIKDFDKAIKLDPDEYDYKRDRQKAVDRLEGKKS